MTRAAALSAVLALGLAGCPSDPPPPADPAWGTVLDGDDLDGVVLSLFADRPTRQVFAAGGPLGNSGFSSIALRYDGAAWHDLAPGGTETFWWTAGSAVDDVWFVGEGGRAARWDGSAFTETDTGTTATLWGAIAFAPDDAWAVGGTPMGQPDGPDDVVLHWDGAAWSPVALPGAPLGRALYKIWGTSADDLYVVGEGGVVWHKVGADFVDESPAVATGTLFTVAGCSATDVYAVGGFDVLHSDGSGAWEKVDVTLTNQVNGVACAGPGEVVFVGGGGQKQRLVDGAWKSEFTKPPTVDLHVAAALPAADGEDHPTFWVAGGDFFSSPKPGVKRPGVVGRWGAGAVGTDLP